MPELYVDGVWTSGRGRRSPRRSTVPPTARSWPRWTRPAPSDTELAIAAAYRAFHDGPWPATSARERGDLLLRVADLLERDADAIALAESRDTGKRLVESRYDVADVASVFRYYGQVAAEDAGRVVDTGNPDVVSRIVHEPVGVCGLIAPWNYPLLQASWKVAPCLAAGNTFVLKPSELTPHTSILLMRLLEEAGLPAGVGNLVLGAGAEAGAPLASDPRVDLVSFTGGVQTGRGVMASAAATVKRVALELGGKNPNIVFADADLDVALDYALTAVFLHSGQVCSAGARLLVEESLHDSFVDALVERAQNIRLGGPFDDKAETGPLISAAHRDKVAAYVAAGLAEGAVLRCGGAAPDDPALADGFYYLPDGPRPLHQHHERHPERVVRSRADRGDLRLRGRSGARSPTTAPTGSPARCGPRTPGRRSASRPGCGWGRCGSTTTTPTCRRPSGAATSSPGSVASSATRASRSIARPSTCGTTSDPRSSAGSTAHRGTDGAVASRRLSRDRALRRRDRGRWIRRMRSRQPAVGRPRHHACWCSRPVGRTSGSTRSSTCPRRSPSRSATGSTTGSTSPTPSRTCTTAGSTTRGARCSAAPAASTG